MRSVEKEREEELTFGTLVPKCKQSDRNMRLSDKPGVC